MAWAVHDGRWPGLYVPTRSLRMSHLATVAAWGYRGTDLSATDRFVLLALADEADSSGYVDGRARRSAAFLAQKTGLSRRTVDRSLASIVEAGAVEVITAPERGGVTRGQPGDYFLTVLSKEADWTQCPNEKDSRMDTVSNRDGQSVQTGADRTSYRSIPGLNPGTSDDVGLEDARRLAEMLATKIEERGSKRPSVTKAWVTEMDRLIRLDGRSPEEVARTIKWLSDGNDKVAFFWRTNILSPQKLRLHWDRMREQYAALKSQPAPRGDKSNFFVDHYVDLVSEDMN